MLDAKSENILKDKLEVIEANMRKEMGLLMEEQRKQILDAEYGTHHHVLIFVPFIAMLINSVVFPTVALFFWVCQAMSWGYVNLGFAS
jgi:hypothetical protein